MAGPYFQPATSTGIAKINGNPVDASGDYYIAASEGVPIKVTPTASALNWYRYSLTVHRTSVSLSPTSPGYGWISTGAIEPDYNVYGVIKFSPIGQGYDADLLQLIMAEVGTQINGVPTVGPDGVIRMLSFAWAAVPTSPQFNTGWTWDQDIANITYVYDPAISTSKVYKLNGGKLSFTLGAPPKKGNDTPVHPDTSPDVSRLIYSADAPGFDPNSPILNGLHKNSIASWRFAARTWANWNGGIMTPVIPWHAVVTFRITSELGAPRTVTILNSQFGPNATLTPMTLQEAQTFYNQP